MTNWHRYHDQLSVHLKLFWIKILLGLKKIIKVTLAPKYIFEFSNGILYFLNIAMDP